MDLSTSYQTMSANAIKYMLKYIAEYESVKKGEHKEFKFVGELFKARRICSQNFHKFYRRYQAYNGDASALLPQRRGPRSKYMDSPIIDGNLVTKVLDFRKQGYNKFVIAAALKKDETLKGPKSASTIYRIFVKYGVSKLNAPHLEEKRTILRDKAGSLVHTDCHYLPKGIVKAHPQKRYYVLGAIDNCSRICWTEVIESTKAIDVTFAMMDVILILHQRYGIQCEEVLTDNGSEFKGGEKTKSSHPYERLLQHFGIKHRYTRPFRPQTNGKIERYWRSFHDEVIEGAEFENLDELKDAVLGYNIYFNEHRPHQGIAGQTPQEALLKLNAA